MGAHEVLRGFWRGTTRRSRAPVHACRRVALALLRVLGQHLQHPHQSVLPHALAVGVALAVDLLCAAAGGARRGDPATPPPLALLPKPWSGALALRVRLRADSAAPSFASDTPWLGSVMLRDLKLTLMSLAALGSFLPTLYLARLKSMPTPGFFRFVSFFSLPIAQVSIAPWGCAGRQWRLAVRLTVRPVSGAEATTKVGEPQPAGAQEEFAPAPPAFSLSSLPCSRCL